MAKLKDLSVVTGTYQKDGQTKKRYQNIGALMSHDNGQYILLDPLINLAAIPREAGRDRVMVSMFDPKPSKGYEEPGDAPSRPALAAAASAQAPLDDEIPF